MKLTNKQQLALKRVEYFIPSHIDWNSPLAKYYQWNDIGIIDVSESSDGIDPIQAFFMRSERGIMPYKVTDKYRFAALLWGQKWMATHIKIYKEDKYCLPHDFLNEPDYIRSLILPEVFNLPADWKPIQ